MTTITTNNSYTYGQQIILAIAPKCTGLLSIVGAVWIIIEISTNRTKRSRVFHRLIGIMSSIDLLASIAFFASTWPIPKYDSYDVPISNIIWNIGNQSTCTLQGFIIQFSICSTVYSACLSIYYQLVIQYNITEEQLCKTFEPIIHCICIVLGIVPAIIGIYLKLYNNANLWCWISSNPLQCNVNMNDDINCIRGKHSNMYRWIFYYILLWICMIVSLLSLLTLRYVLQQRELKEYKQMEFEQQRRRRCTTLIDGKKMTEGTRKNRNGNDGGGGGGGSSALYSLLRSSSKSATTTTGSNEFDSTFTSAVHQGSLDTLTTLKQRHEQQRQSTLLLAPPMIQEEVEEEEEEEEEGDDENDNNEDDEETNEKDTSSCSRQIDRTSTGDSSHSMVVHKFASICRANADLLPPSPTPTKTMMTTSASSPSALSPKQATAALEAVTILIDNDTSKTTIGNHRRSQTEPMIVSSKMASDKLPTTTRTSATEEQSVASNASAQTLPPPPQSSLSEVPSSPSSPPRPTSHRRSTTAPMMLIINKLSFDQGSSRSLNRTNENISSSRASWSPSGTTTAEGRNSIHTPRPLLSTTNSSRGSSQSLSSMFLWYSRSTNNGKNNTVMEGVVDVVDDDDLQQQQQQEQEENDRRQHAEAILQVLKSIASLPGVTQATNQVASRAIFRQAVWYMTMFYITFFGATVNRLVQTVTGDTYYGLLLWHTTFVPLQGFLNFVVYRRLDYKRIRRQHPYLSRWDVIRRICRFSFQPPLPFNDPIPFSSSTTKTNNTPVTSSNQPGIGGGVSELIAQETTDADDAGKTKRVLPNTVGMVRYRSSLTSRIDPSAELESIPLEDSALFRNHGTGNGTGSENDDPSASPATPQWDPNNWSVTDLEHDVMNVVLDFCESYGDYPNLLTDDFGPLETPDPMANYNSMTYFPVIALGTNNSGGSGAARVEEESSSPRAQQFPAVIIDEVQPSQSVEVTES